MELAAQVPEPPLEVLRIEPEPSGQAEEREVISLAAEREDPVALGAEVFVDRRARAAVAALER